MLTTGAAPIMTKGSASASAATPAASLRVMVTSGEDSSMTGNKVQADIDHSEVSRTPMSGASTAGSSSVAQNDAAASLRSAVAGQTMSATVFRAGRATNSTITSGTET